MYSAYTAARLGTTGWGRCSAHCSLKCSVHVCIGKVSPHAATVISWGALVHQSWYACDSRVCGAQAGTSGARHALGPVLSADKRCALALKVVHCLLLTALRLAALANHHLRTRCIAWRFAIRERRCLHGARRTSLGALLTDSVTRCLLSASDVCECQPLLKQPCSIALLEVNELDDLIKLLQRRRDLRGQRTTNTAVGKHAWWLQGRGACCIAQSSNRQVRFACF